MVAKKDKYETLKKVLKVIFNFKWIGKIFDWLDENILSKTTRLWMYLLEIAGVVVIFIMVSEFQKGFEMILKANTELELKKAHLFIESVKNSAGPIATMVATICGAIPVVIGALRSLKTKWANGNGVQKEVVKGQPIKK